MEAVTAPDYRENTSFDDIRAILREVAESQKETDRKMQENAQQIKETGIQMKETDRRWQETDRRWEKTKRYIDNLGKQMGDLHNKFGELAEHLVTPGIVKRFNELGYHFECITDGNMKILDGQGKIKAEVDIYLENGDYIVAVEVKVKPKPADIDHHIRRLEIIREYRSKWHDKRKIRGGIAGAIFDPQVKKAAIEAGIYVLEQSGDTMQIVIPEGFIPQEW